MNSIQITNLRVELNQKMILKGIDLSLASTDCCLVVGKNGSGKSTLFNAMVDNIPMLADGQILVNGKNLKVRKEAIDYKKSIGYAKGDHFLIEELTVKENLLFLAKVYHIDKKCFTEQLDFFQDYLPTIRNFYDRKIALLSTGEYKMTSICASLLHAPPILIWDEPYAGIDLIAVEKMTKMIEGLQQQGRILLVSSHEESVLTQLGTHVLILRNGFQSFFGKKEDLLQASKDFKNGIINFL